MIDQPLCCLYAVTFTKNGAGLAVFYEKLLFAAGDLFILGQHFISSSSSNSLSGLF